MLCKSLIWICSYWVATRISNVSGEIPPGLSPALKLPLDGHNSARAWLYPIDKRETIFDSWPTVKCQGGSYDFETTKWALRKIIPETIRIDNKDGFMIETGYGVVDKNLQNKNLIVKFRLYTSPTLKKGHFILLGVWELVRLHFHLAFLQKTDLLARSNKCDTIA